MADVYEHAANVRLSQATVTHHQAHPTHDDPELWRLFAGASKQPNAVRMLSTFQLRTSVKVTSLFSLGSNGSVSVNYYTEDIYKHVLSGHCCLFPSIADA